jgi:hypothetical protein
MAIMMCLRPSEISSSHVMSTSKLEKARANRVTEERRELSLQIMALAN